MAKDVYLTLRGLGTYVQHDEDCFFECLYKIKSIVNIEGAGIEIYLDFDSKDIPDRELKTLIGLFFRYKVNMNQLQMFVNEKNEHWVKDKNAYWYERMFIEDDKKKKPFSLY